MSAVLGFIVLVVITLAVKVWWFNRCNRLARPPESKGGE